MRFSGRAVDNIIGFDRRKIGLNVRGFAASESSKSLSQCWCFG